MSERTIRRLSIFAILISTSAFAIPPGYTWGLAHCGIGTTCSRSACKRCCERAGQNGDIEPEEVNGCKQACDDIIFQGQCPGLFARALVWFFA